MILQLRLYALYSCSKKLLVFMMILFAAEVGVMMWILVATDLRSYGPSLTSSHFSLSPALIPTCTAAYPEYFVANPDLWTTDNVVETCVGYTTPAYRHLWVPCFAFDAILALLSLWTAVRHLRQYPRSPRFKSQLVNILIQGNAIYFFGCAFSCPHRIAFDNRM